MTSLVLENEPAVARVVVTTDRIVVDLADGRTLSVTLAWYPRLLHGTPPERAKVNLLGDGYAMECPDLDEHIGALGLVAGRRSCESADSLARWLNSRRAPLESQRT
jgi:hypothetical protein